MTAYKDLSGLLTHKLETINLTSGSDFLNTGYMKPEPNMKIEDEEDLLYGESGNAFKVTSVGDPRDCFFFRALRFVFTKFVFSITLDCRSSHSIQYETFGLVAPFHSNE